MSADPRPEPTDGKGQGGRDPRIQAVIDRARPLRPEQIDLVRDLLGINDDGDTMDAA